MIRTQIYLTKNVKDQLHILSQQIGKNRSELIREAIDQFIAKNKTPAHDRTTAILAAKDLWKERKDLPDFAELRRELDRCHPLKGEEHN